ncbi:hypothetical protein GPALN_003529 [Globodera pallida]|uniref:17S U2 SnRNP complex component HTATSF1 n=1 Tax=Globodera pallida TaxID=36090 RepID=A0A183C408_GLOPA|nr:hypothetical protein GPALN_003529 [Globodera pallida]
METVKFSEKETPNTNKQNNQSDASGAATASEIVYPDPNNPYKCIADGVPMTWNEVCGQWLPDVDVDEDFLALYNANYGVQYDYSKMPQPKPATGGDPSFDGNASSSAAGASGGGKEKKPLTKEEKLERKREAAKRPVGWVDLEEQRNTIVYVSGFPPSIDEEQFIEFMSKCGVIMKDPRTSKPKVKLYRTESGEPKGDGTCCYIKMESVELALQILDGWAWDSAHKIHVENAKFEMKGEFDPSKKRRRLTGAQKKRFFERQQKIFEWKPEKPRNYRPHCECTLVLRGMFALEEIDANAQRIFTIKEDTQKLSERFGPVKNVTVYDTNPNGVVTVTFDSAEHADAAVQAMNGRIVAGRVVEANNWDGKEKFKRAETAEERARRENAWEEFLGHDDESDEKKGDEE